MRFEKVPATIILQSPNVMKDERKAFRMEIEGAIHLLEEVIGNPIVIAEGNAIINVDFASDGI